jgi:hypothetical protein
MKCTLSVSCRNVSVLLRALPVPYTRIMPVALLYPQTIQRILTSGLAPGSISTYLGRAIPMFRSTSSNWILV